MARVAWLVTAVGFVCLLLSPAVVSAKPAEGKTVSLDQWQRHVVDSKRPWRSVFIQGADIDGDGLNDIIVGGWWYRNPGDASKDWKRTALGAPLNNMAAVYDFDQDGDVDVLGTCGKGSKANATFVWAENDGSGSLTIHDNIAKAEGDFLQGVAIDRFEDSDRVSVALSWHKAGNGVQMLDVPSNPVGEQWAWRKISESTQDEQLSVGLIAGSSKPDLLLGTQWLQNSEDGWKTHAIIEPLGQPDRNRLADMNGDGRLDAVVGYEAINKPGKLAWYEQQTPPAALWKEHLISAEVVGPMSLDVADLDGDGDNDVIVGEHNYKNPETARLIVLENVDGKATEWKSHVVHTGDEHHDGAVVLDIDNDGDLDIISTGWSHSNVLLYENKAINR